MISPVPSLHLISKVLRITLCFVLFYQGGLRSLSTAITSEIEIDGSDHIITLLFNYSGKKYVLTTTQNNFTVLVK